MKTITKKILSIIVMLVLSITLLPMSAMAEESGDFEYEVDGDGNAEITGYNGSGGAVTIPATLDGYPVTAIDYMAFYDNDSITSVTFEGGINTIGESAFQYCDVLTSVTFEGDVGTIGESAFFWLDNLTSVTFKGDVETIGAYAFYGCSALKDIYFNGTEAEWNAVTKDEAWNAGCPKDMEVHFSEKYTVGASVSPKDAGTVTGAGTYDTGTTATVIATPSNGYSFVNWTEGGNVASTNASYSFTVDKNRSLVANFKLNTYEITADFNDWDGGTVSGGGTYEYGKEITLVATPKAGYVFERWTVDTDSSWTSHSSEISIKVDGNQTYTALFWEVSIGDIDPQEYTGGQIRPTGLKVELIGVDVKLTDEDYGLSYGENVDAGKDAGTVTVAFKDKFTGEVTKTFDITRKPITISGITANDKVVDGTTDAELDLTNVVISGVLDADKDKLTVTATGTFADAAAGENKTVSITNLTLSGDAAANYQLAEDGQQTTTTATILEKKVYSFTSGAESKWTSGSTTALEFVVKANRDDSETFEYFTGIQVDGEGVREKDDSGKTNWTAKSGSVIIDLQPDYLKTLSVGEHTLTVLFDDPYTVDTTFTIEAAQEETKPADTSPKTGDNSHMILWVVLMAAALAGGISILTAALKRRQQ